MTIVIIPARYDSSRFPGKVLVDIAGKPLIQHTYEAVLEQPAPADAVHVATCDKAVAERCREFGASVVLTSPRCSNGTERAAEAATALDLPDGELVVNIQADQPTIPRDIIHYLARFHADVPSDVVTVASTRRLGPEDHGDANLVKVVYRTWDKAAVDFFRLTPETYVACEFVHPRAHVGIYAYSAGYLRRYVDLPPADREVHEGLEQLRCMAHGHRVRVVETDDEPVKVDAPGDVKKAREELARRTR